MEAKDGGGGGGRPAQGPGAEDPAKRDSEAEGRRGVEGGKAENGP